MFKTRSAKKTNSDYYMDCVRLPTHAGRIKCIYIDPPYNTGNEGWVYNDNLTQPQFKEWIGKTVGKEGEDACRHDKWCCMMYPRLTLLRELLNGQGAIFVSIDDNEVASLRMLMDEIFGEDNFVATIIWEKVYSPKSTAKLFWIRSPAQARRRMRSCSQIKKTMAPASSSSFSNRSIRRSRKANRSISANGSQPSGFDGSLKATRSKERIRDPL